MNKRTGKSEAGAFAEILSIIRAHRAGALASVNVELTPQTITRTGQIRQLTITGDSVSGETSDLAVSVQALLDSYDFPEGYRAEIAQVRIWMNE